MNFNRQSVLAVFMALALVGAATGAAVAATATLDTESTDTTVTTDLNAGETQTYNDSGARNISILVDSKNFKFNITDDGHTVLSVTNESDITTLAASNSTAGTYTYNVTVSSDASDYEGISANASENETLTAYIVNNTSVDSPTVNNFSYYFKNSETQEFERVASGDTKVVNKSGLFGVAALSLPDVSMASLSSGFGLFGSSSDSDSTTSEFNGSARATETLNPTENTSKAIVDFESSKADDASANALEASDDKGIVMFASAQIGDSYVPVVKSSSDLPSFMNSSQTYVVLEDGQAVVHNLNETATSQSELQLTLNEKLSGSAYEQTLKATSLGRWDIAYRTAANFDLTGDPDFASA